MNLFANKNAKPTMKKTIIWIQGKKMEWKIAVGLTCTHYRYCTQIDD